NQSEGTGQGQGGAEPLQELGAGATSSSSGSTAQLEELQQIGSPDLLKGPATPAEEGPPEGFYFWFAISVIVMALMIGYYYWKLESAQFEILTLLLSSVMPLGSLPIVVLAVFLSGIPTATESAAVGAAGAFLLAIQARTLNWQRVKE